MPGDGLAFAIGVSRQVERIRLLERADDCLDVLLVALDDLVLHREVAVGVDGAFLRNQVAHVPIGRHHRKVLAQVLFDGLRLGGRFYDDEIFSHSMRNRGQCRGSITCLEAMCQEIVFPAIRDGDRKKLQWTAPVFSSNTRSSMRA